LAADWSGRYSILERVDALLIALAGGSAGAILTMLAGIPHAIRNHDRLVAQVDDDLAQWISDECVRLERAVEAYNEEFARQLDAKTFLRGVAHLHEEALHRYRDQQRSAEARIGEWRDAEGTLHRLLRRFWFFTPFSRLGTPERAEPILDSWREDVSRNLVSAPVSDPTKRSLAWAVEKYGVTAPKRQKEAGPG
jgi:hypothetical protein